MSVTLIMEYPHRTDLRPDMPLRMAASWILGHRFGAMWKYHRAVSEPNDEEAVHDMRVASRRLRAALSEFRVVFTRKQFRKMYKPVRQLTRALGKTRDMEVISALLTSALNEWTSLKALSVTNRKKIRQSKKQLNAYIQKWEQAGYYDRFLAEIHALLATENKADNVTETRLCEHMHRALPLRLETFLQAAGKIDRPEPWVNLHKMRIRAKQLRYALEVYEFCFENDFRDLLNQVKTIQEMLGHIQDRTMIMDYLRHLTKRATLENAKIQMLINRFQVERNQTYNAFMEYWINFKNSEPKATLTGLMRRAILKHTHSMDLLERIFIDN